MTTKTKTPQNKQPLQKKQPLLIAVGGMSGSGKSSLAHALGMVFNNAVYIDSDVMRKKLNGVSPLTPLPETAYSPDKLDEFITYIRAETAKSLKTHDVVIVTGIFLDEKTRGAQELMAQINNARFAGVFLEAPLKTLHSRVAQRQGTVSDANNKVLTRQSEIPSADPAKYPSWTHVNADQPFNDVISDALKGIAKTSAPKAPLHSVAVITAHGKKPRKNNAKP